MLEIPLHAPGKLRCPLEQVLVEHLDREQRGQPDDRTKPERNLFARREEQPVVVEVVLVIPQPASLAAEVGHRTAD